MGMESEGMICAEDEIGIGETITMALSYFLLKLSQELRFAEIFKPKEDYIFEIGLTPNRIDAMSHLGRCERCLRLPLSSQ